METYLIIAQMVLSVALVALILLQSKGSGGLGVSSDRPIRCTGRGADWKRLFSSLPSSS